MKELLFILGTRPEAIKLAPLIMEFKSRKNYNVTVCNTEQQKDLSNQTLDFFELKADINLNVMTPNQSLGDTQCEIFKGLKEIFTKKKFDAIFVQGDTLTVLSGALMAFYNKIPLFHVEAGLRSYDLQEPYPEEGIRQMVSRITTLHFAPTEKASQTLLQEGIEKTKIFVTGNTVIDALHRISSTSMYKAQQKIKSFGIDVRDDIVLITVHRRENHGERLDSILDSILTLSKIYKEYKFVIPVHPNPNVKGRILKYFSEESNIILTPPLDYPCLVSLLRCAKLVLTDSGGIQEEAPTFGTPILVMRYETERTEGVEAGFSKLVGADKQNIIDESQKILSISNRESFLSNKKNPYGDGYASKRIAEIVNDYFYSDKDEI